MQPFTMALRTARRRVKTFTHMSGLSLVTLPLRMPFLPARLGIQELQGQLGPLVIPSIPIVQSEAVVDISGITEGLRRLRELERLARNRAALIKMAQQVLPESGRLDPTVCRGMLLYCPESDFHDYGTYTHSVLVPEIMRPYFEQGDNNVLRSVLSCFGPHAWQIPRELPPFDLIIMPGRDEDFILGTESRDEAIRLFNLLQWQQNTPVDEHVSLGANGQITFSNVQVIRDGDLVMWVGLANTLPSHPLDGRALWVLVYNTRTGKMFMFHRGVGETNVPLVDWLNPYIAAYVFGTKFRTFEALVTTATTADLPWLNGPDRQELLARIYKAFPELVGIRAVSRELDMYAAVGAWTREYIYGPNVFDAPEGSRRRSSVTIEELPDLPRIKGPDDRSKE